MREEMTLARAVWPRADHTMRFFRPTRQVVTRIGSRMRGVNARCLMIPADGDLSDSDHPPLKRALLTNGAVLRV